MARQGQSPFTWVPKRLSNLNTNQIKSKTKGVTLGNDDFHPLQKKEIEIVQTDQKNPLQSSKDNLKGKVIFPRLILCLKDTTKSFFIGR